MAQYGDLGTIKAQLDIESSDTSHDARLTQLNVVASQEFADACGQLMGWGLAGADVSVNYTADGFWSVIPLPKPIWSVTTIMLNDNLVAPEQYALVYPEGNGLYWGIESASVLWSGKVVITGQWGGMPTGVDETDIPLDVVEAVNVLVAGYFRRDQTSEGQVSGPERFTFVPPNPWTDMRVIMAIQRYDTQAEILF
jgi:hypothetical protein